MLNKTKAALQGRSCQSIKLKPSQNTMLIDQVKLTASLAQFDFVSKDIPLVEGEEFPALEHTPIGQPACSSLAFLRWRRLISPLAAATRKPAVLSPFSFNCSISSITSCGIRTVVICDFAFFAPVAIAGAPYVRCMSVYAKKMIKKGLKCISLECSVKCIGEIHLVSAKPGSVGTLAGPLTKPLSGVTIMADIKSNQTRPKYHFRFLALDRINQAATPCRMAVEAYTEQEARQILAPHFILSLAARLPIREAHHV